ncbi:MAG: hypothetical protein KDB83_04420 [Actinobacteria bacterium]|nr:hypothetical protein [Actinomycetota bacterium]MCB0921934.1 hypothetical protein [Actinomycetota bacterium]
MTTCLLLHGAGSTPEFITRTFGAATAERGWALVAPDVRGMTMAQMVELIAAQGLDRHDVVGGVSLGAHAAARYCATTGWTGRLYAVMPAWMGDPEVVAALTRSTAERIDASSIQQVLADIRAQSTAHDWILDELRTAWTAMTDAQLAHALRVAADQPAPDIAELGRITASTRVVALADDPTHPEHVASAWAAAISDATLTVLPRHLPSSAALAQDLW